MENIYREHLIELFSEKKNFGVLDGKTHEVRYTNPVCNDEIIFDLKVENSIIKDAKFRGNMCFVSTISAEILAENIKGMTIDELKKLKKEDIDKFLGVEIDPTRVGCELFPLEALKKLK